jgi:hypothetical protein
MLPASATLKMEAAWAGIPFLLSGFDLRLGHVGFVVHKVVRGKVFLRLLWFLMSIFIPPTVPYSFIIVIDTP